MDLEDLEIVIMRQLEERLLQPDIRHSPSVLDELLSDDFIEFGSSGRAFNKAQVIEGLRKEAPTQINILGIQVQALAHDVRLVLYQAIRPSASGAEPIASLRSSIWKLIDGKWRIIFHQGTPISEDKNGGAG